MEKFWKLIKDRESTCDIYQNYHLTSLSPWLVDQVQENHAFLAHLIWDPQNQLSIDPALFSEHETLVAFHFSEIWSHPLFPFLLCFFTSKTKKESKIEKYLFLLSETKNPSLFASLLPPFPSFCKHAQNRGIGEGDGSFPYTKIIGKKGIIRSSILRLTHLMFSVCLFLPWRKVREFRPFPFIAKQFFTISSSFVFLQICFFSCRRNWFYLGMFELTWAFRKDKIGFKFFRCRLMGCLCFKAAAKTDGVNPSNQTGISTKSSKRVVAPSTKDQLSLSSANADDEAVIAHARSRRKEPETNGFQITIDKAASAAIDRTKRGGSHQRRATVTDANSEVEIVVRTHTNEEKDLDIVGSVPSAFSGDHTAAGWPTWLSSVSAEAVRGWSPRRADSFEKLDKVMVL